MPYVDEVLAKRNRGGHSSARAAVGESRVISRGAGELQFLL